MLCFIVLLPLVAVASEDDECDVLMMGRGTGGFEREDATDGFDDAVEDETLGGGG